MPLLYGLIISQPPQLVKPFFEKSFPIISKKGLDKSRGISYNITTVEDTPERGERLVRFRRSLGPG